MRTGGAVECFAKPARPSRVPETIPYMYQAPAFPSGQSPLKWASPAGTLATRVGTLVGSRLLAMVSKRA